MMRIQGNGAATLTRALPTDDRLLSMSKTPPSTATRYRTILLFGAPGSGKGTQGKIIGNIPGFYHSATGDIFRSLDLQSEMGRKFWEYAGRGELVPDEFTIKLWKQYLNGMEMINQFHPESQFLVLDGLPRNTKQAELLRETIDVTAIIYLRAEKAKMVERLRRRALKENRFDDASDEVISRRMDVFERETRPVLDMYPKEIIHRVDATMSQIRVLGEVVRVLTPLKEAMDHDHETAMGHA
ncbi:MAG: adenylate kinase [Phycisphaerales bacterium]|jgi:adenylate kinase|nr:adenylate kinase [Phycisphaerales bacterium]MDB5304091.1 adenylate kinase [Phycisphaerales bacterium]